jgi:hypothetical protein
MVPGRSYDAERVVQLPRADPVDRFDQSTRCAECRLPRAFGHDRVGIDVPAPTLDESTHRRNVSMRMNQQQLVLVNQLWLPDTEARPRPDLLEVLGNRA